MAQLIGIANLGRDAEVRFTPNGQPVANLALAFNYGRKGDDGNRPTQWVDGALWGQRAEALGEYLTRGTKVYVVIDDVHIETYEGQNGQGHKLVGTIATLEFAGSPREAGGDGGQQRQGGGQQRQAQGQGRGQGQQRQAQGQSGYGQGSAPRQGQQQRQQAPRQQQSNSGSSGFDDMDDDIPF